MASNLMAYTVSQLKIFIMDENDVVSATGNNAMHLFILFFIITGEVNHFSDDVFMSLEFLHFRAVFYVQSEDFAIRVSDKQLEFAFVHHTTGQLAVRKTAMHADQLASKVPNFYLIRMQRDELEMFLRKKHLKTHGFICEILVFRFIIVIEMQATFCDHDTFLGIRHAETIDLIDGDIEGLHAHKITDIPYLLIIKNLKNYLDHAFDIGCHDLRRIRNTFHTH